MSHWTVRRWIGLAAIVGALAGFVIATSGGPEPVRMLRGHDPYLSALIESAGDHYEIQVYSWEADYSQVVKEFRAEASEHGFSEDRILSAGGRTVFRSQDGAISITHGWTRDIREAKGWYLDSRGVTIHVRHNLPDNLITWLKMKTRGVKDRSSLGAGSPIL